MHTEHLENVKLARVGFGWFISVAVMALAMFAFTAAGLMEPAVSTANVWTVLALLGGFFAGGWFTGYRQPVAPLLHGAAIGLTSLVVWFLVNLLLGEPLGATTWTDPPPVFTAGALILQMGAAAGGAWIASAPARAATRPTG